MFTKFSEETFNKEIGETNIAEVAVFLSDFADTLMGAGAQTSRIVKSVSRLSENFGCKIDMILLPKTIIMSLSQGENSYTKVTKLSNSSFDFTRISKLRMLSWDAIKNGWSLKKCQQKFIEIKQGARYGWVQTAFVVSMGNAALCQLFGGFYSIPIVFVVTLLGFMARRSLQIRDANTLFATFVAAFVSSSLAGCCSEIFSFKTDICISTSVLYLIPGVPMLNSFIDILEGHILSGVSRLVQAAEVILSISLGLLGAILILGHSIL